MMDLSARVRRLVLPLALGSVAVAALASILVVDRHLAHGVRARFFEQAEERPITTTIEHRTSFMSSSRPISRVVEGWDRSRAPAPARPLPFIVKVEGWLEVPPGPARPIRALTKTTATVEIDGRPAAEAGPGRHRLRVTWRTSTNSDANLRLAWTPGEHPEAIPDAAFSIIGGAPLGPRVLAALGITLFFAAFALTLARAMGPGRETRSLGLFLFVATALLGLFLRSYDYAVVPVWNDNADEMYVGWDGIELLTTGRTRGWSLFEEQYPESVPREVFLQFGQRYVVLTPAFEHPPLMHVLAGVVELAAGAKHYGDAQIAHLRLVSLFLFVPTIILLFLLARRLVPEAGAAHLGCLFYAVQPTIVLQSRAAKEEVLLVPFALGAVLLLVRLRDLRAQGLPIVRTAFFAGLVMGIGIIVKVPAVFFCLAVVVLTVREGGLRAGLFASLGVLVGIALLLLFAALTDWGIFWHATAVQASIRAALFNVFQRYFVDAFISRTAFGRGHLLFVWLAYFAAMRGRDGKIDPFGVVPPLTYLGALAISAGDFNFGWYLLPVYPFLCVYAGRFLRDAIVRPNVGYAFLVIGLLVMYSCNFITDFRLGRSREGWEILRPQVAATFYVLFLPVLLDTAFRKTATRTLARLAMACAFAAFVLMSAYTVVRYEQIRDTHGAFDWDDFYNS